MNCQPTSSIGVQLFEAIVAIINGILKCLKVLSILITQYLPKMCVWFCSNEKFTHVFITVNVGCCLAVEVVAPNLWMILLL